MRTSNKIVKIAFVGASGSGKTTCGKLVAKIIKTNFQNYKAIKLNVALPLHRAQAYIYRSFDLKNSGQDSVLLQFLAAQFEKRLGPTFEINQERLLAKYQGQRLVIINTDCRNNAYQYLKRAGYVFVKVEVGPETLARRLEERGDIRLADAGHRVEQIDQIKPNYTIENNGSLADLESKLRVLVSKILRPR